MITMLKAKGGQFAAKTITRQADGGISKAPYGKAAHFSAEVRQLANFQQLSALLFSLEEQRDVFVVRGIPAPHANIDNMTRTVHDKVNRETGEVTQQADLIYAPGGLQWLCVDMDELKSPGDGMPPQDGMEADKLIRQVIAEYLPTYFHDVHCHYQWSSSQGIEGWHSIRVHLWFWMDRTIPCERLKDWAKRYNADYRRATKTEKDVIDWHLFVGTQPNYTAAPELIGFDKDPVPQRSGVILADSDAVSIPEAALMEPITEKIRVPKADNDLYRKKGDDWELVYKALDCIPASCGYDEWVTVGMALYSASNGGGVGFSAWDNWSCKGEGYKPNQMEAKWRSFNGNKLSIGTLYHIAKGHGFEFPKNPRYKEGTNGTKRRLSQHELAKINKGESLDDMEATPPWGEADAPESNDPVRDDPTHGIGDSVKPITMPELYYMDNNWLYKLLVFQDKSGEPVEQPVAIYPGELKVVAVEVDADGDGYSAVVEFETYGNRKKTVTAPLEQLATGMGVIRNLSKQGAAVSDRTSKDVAQFLIDYFHHNRNSLKHIGFTRHLGLIGERGLVAPGGSAFTKVEYRGQYVGDIGHDWDKLTDTLRECSTWEGAWPLWLDLAYSLASPLMERLKLRRNPVLTMIGESGSGKSTSRYFAMAMWGDPELSPWKTEATRSTTKAYTTEARKLNGLPMHIDEIHTAEKPQQMESFCYAFGNKKEPSQASMKYGETLGGGQLHGCLFMTGENLFNITYKGVFNRMIVVNADNDPPLGTPGKINITETNPEGRRRANILEACWLVSTGLLGPKVYEYIMTHIDEFCGTVADLAKSDEYKALEQWNEVIAIMTTTLQFAFEFLDMPIPAEVSRIPSKVKDLVEASKNGENDPSEESWHNVLGLLASCKREMIEDKESYISKGGDLLAWRVQTRQTRPVDKNEQSDRYEYVDGICVNIQSGAFKYVVPKFSHVGRLWLKRGHILGHGKNGNDPAQPRLSPTDINVRCIVIPMSELNGSKNEPQTN